MKTIALIGATGSIGKQVCAVVRRYPDKFQIKSLVANASAEEFLALVAEFQPTYAALVDEQVGRSIAHQIPDGVQFAYGSEGAEEALAYADVAFIATTGFSGLKYTLRAIELGKTIALANKETLVCGGELVMRKAREKGVEILPVDSEHSALWQALSFRKDTDFKRLILTASGGPFYGYSPEKLQKVAPMDALKHPTWQMGAKITIDSATLLNKGFEVIEARWLYDAPLEKIHTVVQPESIIHSMVEFTDGCVMAQMSYPSMELPIQLALTYPDRMECGLPSLNFEKLGNLRFLPLDRKEFPCYDLALTSLERGENYPCALNGAGEVAVHAFLDGKIPFLGIAEVMEQVLCKTSIEKSDTYAVLQETDARARALAREYIGERYDK
ncbi:MAG: 1-deoxy-D-xylulose-5-phosphate reductoisomerase [Clostridia bacterium]|nr:1-deoxy-D-xylulose-5-phosphate reductoisomerase [Clostridia bacterium]